MKKNIQECLTYITPKFVFIPFDEVGLLRIKKNKVVFNNMFLGNRKNGEYIYSPVSGNIIGMKDMRTIDGMCKALVIENDFIDRKEKINVCKSYNNLLKLKKSEVNDILVKYNFDKKFGNKKNLLVSSTYNKNNDLGDMVLNYEEYEVILETIDFLMEKYNIKNAYINIPKEDLYSDFAYNKYINAFDNICTINNTKKLKVQDMICLTVMDVFDIYKAICKNYYNEDMFVTIYENSNSIILKIKEYTSLIELFNDFKVSYKGKNVFVNDVLIDNIDLFIITKKVKSIVIK